MPVDSVRTRWVPSILGSCVLGLIATGCVQHGYSRAHVYSHSYPGRVSVHTAPHRHPDVSLTFDRSLDCYVVVGYTHHYFHRDRYYRRHQGRWQVGPRIRGPWVWVDVKALPLGLRRHHARHFGPRYGARPVERKRQLELSQQRRAEERRLAKERRELERELAKDRRRQEQELSKAKRRQQQELAKARRANERREVEPALSRDRRRQEQKSATDNRRQEQKSEKARRRQEQELSKARRARERQEVEPALSRDRRRQQQKSAKDNSRPEQKFVKDRRKQERGLAKADRRGRIELRSGRDDRR